MYKGTVHDAARQSEFIDATGVSLHYAVSGEGPGMILFHELGGSLHSWDGVVPTLEAEFRVLRFDQRGHGLSEKVRRPFGMEDHASDALALAAAVSLSGPFWLVGAAAGAAAAVELAARAPEKVAGIVMCAPSLSAEGARRTFLEARIERAVNEGMRAIADESLERSYPDDLRFDRRRFEDYCNRWLSNDPFCYAIANRALINATLDDAIASLGCPCLLIAGIHDSIRPPEYVQSIVGRIRSARYAQIDCGHLVPVQAPLDLAGCIRQFIQECGTTLQSNDPKIGVRV